MGVRVTPLGFGFGLKCCLSCLVVWPFCFGFGFCVFSLIVLMTCCLFAWIC